MRSQIDLERLDKITKDIALLHLRFPVAIIAKRTGLNKSNVSKMLKGKEPCSERFFNTFYASFGSELAEARSSQGVNMEFYSGCHCPFCGRPIEAAE